MAAHPDTTNHTEHLAPSVSGDDISLPDPSHSVPLGTGQQQFFGAPEGVRESVVSSIATPGGGNASNPFRSSEHVADVSDRGNTPQLNAAATGAASKEAYADESPSPRASGRKRFTTTTLALIGAAVLAVLVLVIVLPVYFTVVKKNQNNAATGGSGGGGNGHGGGGKPGSNGATTGGDGSVITMEDGTTFTYKNSFGGYWIDDPNDPFNNGARAQSWSPALNESFRYGVDKIRGVNLGGWLNTEPFITPAYYQKYQKTPTDETVGDEWMLSLSVISDPSTGGLQNFLENHYNTFITEQDFAQIAGAGLNFVRIPLPFWAIETRDDEPFLAHVSWKYFLKAIKWARKYGLRINLDLHAVPGSQNGYNHSGKSGQVNFLNGLMGIANAQRTLDYIRILTEFISQPEYKDVVVYFGVVNEALVTTIGLENMSRFYYQVHQMLRGITGYGEGNGPWMSIHDGFEDPSIWANFMPGADRLAMDMHPYFCFGSNLAPPLSAHVNDPCTAWGAQVNGSMSTFGFTAAGEWSVGWNDCGLFLNGVGLGTRYEGTFPGSTGPAMGNCSTWTDWASWTDDTKSDLNKFALSSMDALQNWFFWTWKIANSTAGSVESPLWSYQLGLENGWIPLDPRSSTGACGNTSPFAGPLAPPSRTGGVGAGTIDSAWAASYSQWPPATMSPLGDAAFLPTYTPTGLPIPSLPVPTFTNTKINAGNGWFDANDITPMMVNITGCTYPDAWSAASLAAPVTLCGDGGAIVTAPATTRAVATTARAVTTSSARTSRTTAAVAAATARKRGYPIEPRATAPPRA
ncbi:glycoside hydrolase family 5 protein [Botryobasidium botryosum FD-172 SS1]|uniref:glucan 1,3-beta-glucosidase n=1 Tax=Botryobasidium botryosum (strain FD-172 SS1) TaxID=930990 RepID=A0A067MZB0_BOTB1|nr:glycoside hydrolase family 5 protein [Botryobasidium botryosum FD-172 SS1]